MKFFTFLVIAITLIAVLKVVFYDYSFPSLKKNKDIFSLIKNVDTNNDKTKEETPYIFLTVAENEKELGDIIIFLYQKDLPVYTNHFRQAILQNNYNTTLLQQEPSLTFQLNNFPKVKDNNLHKYKNKTHSVALDKEGKCIINLTNNFTSNAVVIGKVVDGIELMEYISKKDTPVTIIKNGQIRLEEEP